MSRAASTGRMTTAALIGLLTVATLAGFLDQLSWVFEPASFFRLQYAGVLAIAGIAALAFRRFRLGGLAAVMAGINIAAIAPWHGAGNQVAPSGAPVVRVVAFNVDGANHRYGELAPLIERLKPDILGLTELTPAWSRAAATASPLLRPRRLVAERDVYGMGVLSRIVPTAISVERFPASGPVIVVARFEVSGQALTFVLVHVHTSFAGSVHVRELRALAAARPQFGRRLVVCGDFNTVPWSAQLGEFAESTGLRDAFAGSWPVYSWPAWSPLLRVPLDHCLISPGLSVRSHSFGPSSGSDHFPLVVDLALTPLDR
jgi:endonuclease/exonuclease/phosphatase (EEP) superfamily protein YafD